LAEGKVKEQQMRYEITRQEGADFEGRFSEAAHEDHGEDRDR